MRVSQGSQPTQGAPSTPTQLLLQDLRGDVLHRRLSERVELVAREEERRGAPTAWHRALRAATQLVGAFESQRRAGRLRGVATDRLRLPGKREKDSIEVIVGSPGALARWRAGTGHHTIEAIQARLL